MLTCREMTALGTRLLEGDLPLRTRLAARIHLAMCVHCRRFQRQLAMLVQALSLRGDAQAVSGEFVDRVVAAIERAADDSPGRNAPES